MNFTKNMIKENKPDYILFFIASFLIIISIIFSYSLSIYTVVHFDYNQFHFFLRQLVVGTIAIFIMWSLSEIDPQKIFHKFGFFLFFGFFALMTVMPFLPGFLVTETLGARRWIKLPGFSIAPVEFFKIGFVYFLSKSFYKRLLPKPKHLTLKDEATLYVPYIIIFIFLIWIIAVNQKDLGQLVLLALTMTIMLIFANRSYKVFAFLAAVGIVGIGTLIAIAPHRIDRLQSWWSMVQDNILSIMPDFIANALRVKEFPEPYQVGHSLNAIYNGSFTGTGIGEGALKMGFLSEVHTDFVLAGITEEIGFIGLFVVVALLFFLVQRIIRISRRVEDTIYHLFTLGISLLIIIAFLINFGGITGSIPIKGIAVPFLSYGGSSMLSMSIAIGLVLSISRDIPRSNK